MSACCVCAQMNSVGKRKEECSTQLYEEKIMREIEREREGEEKKKGPWKFIRSET